MANLFPKHTGLPFVVWLSIRGESRIDDRPAVHLIEGEGTISPYHLSLLTEWINLNRETILQYWNEAIDTVDLAAGIVLCASSKATIVVHGRFTDRLLSISSTLESKDGNAAPDLLHARRIFGQGAERSGAE